MMNDLKNQPTTARSVLDTLHDAVAQQQKYAQGGVAAAPVETLIGEVNIPVYAKVREDRKKKVDTLLTATLETSLGHLDDLRRTLERTNQKNIDDVRKRAGWGSDLLAAIEGRITYYDLVQLINEMRDGIAMRRAAALGVLA